MVTETGNLRDPTHRSSAQLLRDGSPPANGVGEEVERAGDGKLTSHYSRTYIEAAQLLPGTPALTDAQWRALELLAATAEELCLEMRLAPGDLQFLNNHVIYHARGAFQDDPAQGRRRLLYRVWLAMANSRALPDDHAVLWGDVGSGGRRGGIGQDPIAPDRKD